MKRWVRGSRPFGLGPALVLLAALASPRLAQAAPARWRSSGPLGGGVNTLAVDPSNAATLYAGTATGVAKSTDGGLSWSWSPQGGPNGSGGYYGGPYDVQALVMHPANPAVVYAATNNTTAGIFQSTNAGATWTRITSTEGWPGPFALAITPANPLVMYAGPYAWGAYKSTDAGASWEAARTGLPSPTTVTVLTVDPVTPSTLYAATGWNGTPTGIFKSVDAGGNWAPVNNGLSNLAVSSLAIDPASPSTLYAGTSAGASGAVVFKSTNGGGLWSPSATGMPNYDVHALALDATAPGTIYAGMYGGVFKTTDSGNSWSAANTGIWSSIVLALAAPSSGTLYAGMSAAGQLGGLHVSHDAGQTWTHPGVPSVSVGSLEVAPSQPTTVYAGTYDTGVRKSTDAGRSWTLAIPGLSESVPDLAVDPRDAATVYAAVRQQGLFKSTDAGAQWSQIYSVPLGLPFVSSVAVDPITPDIVYVGISRGGCRRSTDGGGTWSDASSGLHPFGVFNLVIDPQNPTTLYGLLGGVYKTTNSGASWAPIPGGPTSTTTLAIDPATPSTLYLGTSSAGVLKSTDGASTWTPANVGLPASAGVSALAADPAHRGTVYAGTTAPFAGAAVVFRTTDGGASWSPAGVGLPDRRADALAVEGGAVYAGLASAGVWQLAAPPKKGDLNGDGVPDLLFRSTTNLAHNKAWFMDGVTRSAEADITPDAPSASWRVRGVDDFDADGQSDLAFWNEATGQVEFWLMNGVSRIGAPVPISAPQLPPDWDLSATADFNHDTQPDIVWRSQFSGQIGIWTMNGTGAFGNIVPSPDHAVNANWAIVAAADYNNDGNTDFLWYNATSGKIVTWYMDASVVRTTGQFTTPDAAGNNNWKVVASADYSRAYVPGTPPVGSPDIVWRNETSGNQVVWHLDFNSMRVHGEFTSPTANSPALDWTIVGPR